MVQRVRPTLPQAVLKAIMDGNRVNPSAAQREADKADYDAGWAYLDGRPARCKELRKRASKLRQMAAKAAAQDASQSV